MAVPIPVGSWMTAWCLGFPRVRYERVVQVLIHTPTLFLVLAAISLLAAGAFWQENQRSPGKPLLLWVGAYCAAAGLAISSLLFFPLDANFAIIVPNGFGILSLSLMAAALASYLGHRARVGYWAFLPAAIWFALAFPRWYGQPLADTYVERRIVLCILYFGIPAAVCALLLTAERVTRTMRALAIVFALYGAFYLLRFVMLVSAFVPDEMAMADFWLTFSIYKSVLFVAATAYLFLLVWREQFESDLRMAAEGDPLTNLPNRRSFRRRAERKLLEKQPFVLCFIDLDNFKSVNDRCGHAVGDAILCEFADVLRASLRAGDVCGRLGGEEFACILHAETSVGAVQRLAAIAGTFRERAASITELPAPATFSAGVVASGDGTDLDWLMGQADAALYRAKGSGRNRVEVAGERQSAIPTHLGEVARS